MRRNLRTSTFIAALALLLACLAGCSRHRSGAAASLTVKGSDTMVNLLSNLAEAYTRTHPQAHVSVTGGGSGTGITALIAGTTDICAASRPFEAREQEAAKALHIAPTATVIALDGISVMVHGGNPLTELTLEQLRKIYTGEYTQWPEVGGAPLPILVLSRESNSGTYLYFKEHILNKGDFTPEALLLPSTAAIVKAVRDDAGAIGYGGLAYADNPGVKTLRIKAAPDSAAVAPTVQTIQSRQYPISRPLYLYTNGAATGAAKGFLEYCLSADGRRIVEETGFIPPVEAP
jgi:phosphate transport system substrate-binding protein